VEKVLEVTPVAPPRTLWQKILGVQNAGVIGVGLSFDLSNPVVANCNIYLDKQGPLPLPRGATITSVAGNAVANWEQIINQLRGRGGEEVVLEYRSGNTEDEKSMTIAVPTENGWLGFAYRPKLGNFFDLPWEPQQRMYKAKNWPESLRMATITSSRWITQTYLNIRGMLTNRISPKNMSGPVGILNITYKMAKEKSFVEFCHWMAMINVLIAVFNFLPLPVLDGGHIVFLLVEKIKGSPVSPKIQMSISYVGMALLFGFVLYVTFHDIIRLGSLP
jgi:regulator of sigma E protease